MIAAHRRIAQRAAATLAAAPPVPSLEHAVTEALADVADADDQGPDVGPADGERAALRDRTRPRPQRR